MNESKAPRLLHLETLFELLSGCLRSQLTRGASTAGLPAFSKRLHVVPSRTSPAIVLDQVNSRNPKTSVTMS